MGPALSDISWSNAGEWAATDGARVAFIIAAALAANTVLQRLVPPAVLRAAVREPVTTPDQLDLRKRVETLTGVLVHTGQIIVLLIAVFMTLDQLGFNVAPFLTGLGIGGIALGLGAQSLVRDTISGIFILIENQYGRGDLVTIGGVQGWVEDVSLRRTLLRDADGTIYTVPNGEVKVAGNLTRGYSGINLVIPLAPDTDVERAMRVIDDAGREVAADHRLSPLIVEPPHVARIDAITDKGVTVRVVGKTMPGAQFEVGGAFRLCLTEAFAAAGLSFGPPPAAPVKPTP